MKLSTTLALSALLSLVTGQPIIEKREGSMITVTDWVIVTVDVYTTVAGDPPAASPAADNKHANHIAYHAQNKAEVQAQPTPSSSPPPVQQPAPQNTPAPVQQKQAAYVAPPAPSSSAAAAAAAPPAGSSPEQIQAAEDAKQEAINSAQKSADFAHQSQMDALQNGGGNGGGQAPATPPPAQQPAATPALPAPAQSQAPSTSSGGSGGSCGSIGGHCSGDVTIYNDQGTGACGWANDTNSEDFFALAAPMFGDYSNDGPQGHKNAFCGRMASIQVNGKSYTGMLTDRCGGCVGQSIDLSQHLFSQLYPNEPPGNGRYYNVPWEFTSRSTYSPG